MPAPGRLSYSSERVGLLARARELRALYRLHRTDLPARVERIVGDTLRARTEVEDLIGPLHGCRILEVGPGQRRASMACLALDNDVVGIDRDPVASGTGWRATRRALRGDHVRALKTAGRRALGLDRAFDRELRRTLGVDRLPERPVAVMDAGAMGIAARSVDVVYSRSVLEHLAEPATVLREVRRVLRPGGVAHLGVHLYTSANGCHDPRLFAPDAAPLPPWPHLRPRYRSRVRPNAYLNRLTFDEWTARFECELPGARVVARRDERLRAALSAARSQGDLAGYRDEELLTHELVVIWQRPES